MPIIKEDGSLELEEGLTGVIHETAIAEQIRQETWKQEFFQQAYRKLRSHRPLPQLLTESSGCENILERGWEK